LNVPAQSALRAFLHEQALEFSATSEVMDASRARDRSLASEEGSTFTRSQHDRSLLALQASSKQKVLPV
jgi:hypothetical protein